MPKGYSQSTPAFITAPLDGGRVYFSFSWRWFIPADHDAISAINHILNIQSRQAKQTPQPFLVCSLSILLNDFWCFFTWLISSHSKWMQGKCGLRRYLIWQTLRLSHYLLSLGTQNTNPLVLAGWAVGIRGPGFRWHFFLFFLWEFRRLSIRHAPFGLVHRSVSSLFQEASGEQEACIRNPTNLLCFDLSLLSFFTIAFGLMVSCWCYG